MTDPCSVKVILIGESGSGKTALTHRYCNNEFNPDLRATVGVEFYTKKLIIGDQCVTIKFRDTAGQERFGAITKSFFRDADACLLVFDVTEMISFVKLNNWKTKFLDAANPQEPEGFPFVVIGSKTDMEKRVVTTSDAQEWCEMQNMPYIECSAKSNMNVNFAFKTAAALALQHKEKQLANVEKSFSFPAKKDSFKSFDERSLSLRHRGPAKPHKSGAVAFYNDDDDDDHSVEREAIERSRYGSAEDNSHFVAEESQRTSEPIHIHVHQTQNTINRCSC